MAKKTETPGVFLLTKDQCSLIADALDIISPDDDEAATQAEALAIQFRNASEGRKD